MQNKRFLYPLARTMIVRVSLVLMAVVLSKGCKGPLGNWENPAGTTPFLLTAKSRIRPGSLALVVFNEIGIKLQDKANITGPDLLRVNQQAMATLDSKQAAPPPAGSSLRLLDSGDGDKLGSFLGDMASGFMAGVGSLNSADSPLGSGKLTKAVQVTSAAAFEAMESRVDDLDSTALAALVQGLSRDLVAGLTLAGVSAAQLSTCLQAISSAAMTSMLNSSLITEDNAQELSAALVQGSSAGLAQVAATNAMTVDAYQLALSDVVFAQSSAISSSDGGEALKTQVLTTTMTATVSSLSQLSIAGQTLGASDQAKFVGPIIQSGVRGIADKSGTNSTAGTSAQLGTIVNGALQGLSTLALPAEVKSQAVSQVSSSALAAVSSLPIVNADLAQYSQVVLGQTSANLTALGYTSQDGGGDRGKIMADVVSASLTGLKTSGRDSNAVSAVLDTMVSTVFSGANQSGDFSGDQVTSIASTFKEQLAGNFTRDTSLGFPLDTTKLASNISATLASATPIVAPPALVTIPVVANAGLNKTVSEKSLVSLDASNSTGPAGTVLTYLWQQTSGKAVSFSAANQAKTTFTAPNLTANGTLTFKVTVSSAIASSSATVTIAVTASNEAPTLTLSSGGTLAYHQAMILRATAVDPEGSSLTYWWQQTSGSQLTITNPTSAAPTLSDDHLFGGVFAFKVTVSDGVNSSDSTISFTRQGMLVPDCSTVDLCPLAGGGANPVVAMKKDSTTAMAAWSHTIGANSYIFKSEYRSNAWTHPAVLSDKLSPTNVYGDNASSPKIAMDSSGNALIVWMQNDTTATKQLYKAEYRGGAWTKPTDINDNFSPHVGAVSSVQLAMDDNGNALIVWEQADNFNQGQVFKSEYRSAAWTHPTGLSNHISPNGSPNGQGATTPQVAMDNNGNAIITWSQSDGTNSQIFKSEYRAGAWTNPSGITNNISPDGSNATLPRVAMDNRGNGLITWIQGDNSAVSQVFKSEYRSAAWTNPASLSDNISPDGTAASLSTVVMDDLGNSIIAWLQANNSAVIKAFKSEYRANVWTNPSSLNDSFSSVENSLQALNSSMDKQGNAFILWEASDGVLNRAYASEFRSSTGKWSHPSAPSDYFSSPAANVVSSSARAALDNLGGGIVVWAN